MIWPLAAVIIAGLAWDVARRHIGTRRAVEVARVEQIEERLDALRDTGKVLANLSRRMAGVERSVIGAPGDEA
jgi:hypothetical protein